MKFLKTIFAFFLLICQTSCQKNLISGTWNKCSKNGSYFEFKITDHNLIMISTSNSDQIGIYKVEAIDNGIIISDYDYSKVRLLTNNDTLKIISKLKNKIVLKSINTWDKIKLNKADFKYDKIDSTNLESWKNKTISEYRKRAELINCPDLRTEEEKNIPPLDLDDFEEEEIPIIEVK